MIVVADYEKISDVGRRTIQKKEELDSQLNELMSIISNDIRLGWNGEVYENFKDKSLTYLKNLRKVLNDLNYVGDYLAKVSQTYNVIEEDFNVNMKKAGEEYEK